MQNGVDNNFLKLYLEGSDKNKKNPVPGMKKTLFKFFMGTVFDKSAMFYLEGIEKKISLNICETICGSNKITEKYEEDKIFKTRKEENKDLVAIYISCDTTLNIMAVDSFFCPLIEIVKTIKIKKNSLIFLPSVLKKTIEIDGKFLLYCFGNEGLENFKNNFRTIQENIPRVITCYKENLKEMGFSNIQSWIDSNPQKNIYIGRRPPTFEIDENGKKTRTKLNVEISPLAISRSLKNLKNQNEKHFEISYSDYLDELFEKKVLKSSDLFGKILGCWCKENQKCNCSIIIQKYKEKTFRELIE